MSGAIGALSAWLDNAKRVAGRNFGDMMRSPDDFGRMASARIDEDMTKQFSDQDSVMDWAGGPLGKVGAGLLGVIKGKGGQWLKPDGDYFKQYRVNHMGVTPEERLVQLGELRGTMTDPASIARLDQDMRERMGDAAINKWIDGPYSKYTRRDMGTPEDPLRALAEQGQLHFDPFTRGIDMATVPIDKKRRSLGFPEEGLGVSEAARRYEQLADEAVDIFPAGRVQNRKEFTVDNPWIEGVPPETTLYQHNDLVAGNTGLRELSNSFVDAFRQGDNLPPHLQLTPEKLQSMSMEKASRYVNELNTYKATEEARRAREVFDQAPTVRDYGAYKWKQLDAPHLEGAERDKFITDILKHEGDTMRHCAAGECEDVRDGLSKVYSLRGSEDGMPHVTIEVRPVGSRLKEDFDYANSTATDEGEYIDMMTRLLKQNNLPVAPAQTGPEFYQLNREVIEQPEKFLTGGGVTHEIRQVKGGANSRPKDEYQEYITDFIKNPPLPNMKLVDDFNKTNFLDNYELSRLREPFDLNFGPLGIDTQSVKFDVPDGHYTKSDIRDLLNAQRPTELNDDIWKGFMRRWND